MIGNGARIRFKTPWYKSISFKILATLVLLSGALVLCTSILFFRFYVELEETEHQKRARYIAETLSYRIIEPLLRNDLNALHKLLDPFKETEKGSTPHERIIEYVAIHDHKNSLLAYVGDDSHKRILSSPDGLNWRDNEILFLDKSGETFEVVIPVLANGAPVGSLQLGVTRAHELEEVRRLGKIVWMVAVSLTIIATLISFLVTRHFTAPLLQVIRAAKKISEGNWGTQIVAKSNDETGELIESFNKMSTKLEEAFDRVQRTREKLIQSEKLNAIGKFAASLAHELKNPLNSIALCVQAMEEPGCARILEAQERQMLLREVRRMDEIVSRLLSHGAPTKINLTSVNVNTFLRQVRERMHPRLRAAGVEMKLFLAQDLPKVFMDSDKMGEAIENLCVNAIYATPWGGEIRIRTSRNEPEKAVQIDVEDTGEGIDEKIREHLFEPFYTTRTNGSGLGLHIVHQIVQEHGGKISVTGVNGTVFSIVLPL